jgi:DNA-binding response OmpR family regulator
MPLTLVLSVGPNASLLETRNIVLRSAGYLVESASSMNEAVHRFLAGDFDLVILCHSVPIRERARVEGQMFEIITKPVHPNELLARLVSGKSDVHSHIY